MVCGKEAQYSDIIAISANQIVPPKFRGPTKMLYYIHQTPLSYCSVEGGSGDETRLKLAPAPWQFGNLLNRRTPGVMRDSLNSPGLKPYE